MAKANIPTVNVTEVLYFDCPVCCHQNYAPGWVEQGDKVLCKKCGLHVKIGEHYADCRPAKITKPIECV